MLRYVLFSSKPFLFVGGPTTFAVFDVIFLKKKIWRRLFIFVDFLDFSEWVNWWPPPAAVLLPPCFMILSQKSWRRWWRWRWMWSFKLTYYIASFLVFFLFFLIFNSVSTVGRGVIYVSFWLKLIFFCLVRIGLKWRQQLVYVTRGK